MFWYVAQKTGERSYMRNSKYQVIKLCYMQRWKECENSKAPSCLCKALLHCLPFLHLRGLEISGVPNWGDGNRCSSTGYDTSMLNLCYKVARVLPGFGHQKLYSELSMMQKGADIFTARFKNALPLFSLGWRRGRCFLMIIKKKTNNKTVRLSLDGWSSSLPVTGIGDKLRPISSASCAVHVCTQTVLTLSSVAVRKLTCSYYMWIRKLLCSDPISVCNGEMQETSETFLFLSQVSPSS